MRVNMNPDAFVAKVESACNEGLTAAVQVLADGMVRKFGTRHGGVPSRPGEPPNTQTGHLRNSVSYAPAVDLVAYAGTNVDYGRFLEFGTSKMAPRPWMRPALAEKRGEMIAAFTAKTKAALSGGGLSFRVGGGGA